MTTAKALETLKPELRFIRRQANQMESDFELCDAINIAVRSALEAVDEIELDMQPAVEDEALAA